VGLLFLTAAVLVLLAGWVQINPVWQYGPFVASQATVPSQPDWYVGWLEGALRLFPAWRLHVFGFTISEVFWPGVVLPTVTFGLLYLWPFLEARVTGDHDVHHLLDRPRHRPWRTAIGTSVLSFYVVLFIAGSQDIGAQKLAVSIPTVTWTLRALLLVIPVVVFSVTWKLCHDLTGAEALEERKHSIRSTRPDTDRIPTSPDAPQVQHLSLASRLGRSLASGLLVVAAWLLDTLVRRRARSRAR
jgi:ubiquinol-cytochrome c reductase cytochrome b subunit